MSAEFGGMDMEMIAPYTHNRNYGCRFRRYSQDGIEMLSMENTEIKVVISVGKGCDIVEFLHKKSDIDFMWHSFNEQKSIRHLPTVANPSGNFLDGYAGGWQELFPTYGGAANYHGAQIGANGEACIYPWDCRIVEDTPACIEAELSLRLLRSPFLLQKNVRIVENSATLSISETITNLASREMDFMWGQHPAFGFPFLSDQVTIRISGQPKVKIPQHTITKNSPFSAETVGVWPFLTDKNGAPVDMRAIPSENKKVYMAYLLSELCEGKYEIVNHAQKIGMRLSWDLKTFPYLWVWGVFHGLEEYPWYGRSYVLAVEPWSSAPGNYEQAKENGSLLHLKPGESIKTDLSACAYTF